MTTLQTLLIFFSGYLMSRMALATDVHRLLLERLVSWSRGRMSRLILGVMVLSCVLSTFVPNALTILAVAPLLTLLLRRLSQAPRQTSSLLAVALVHGANIGGVASLIGSPANLYLLLQLRLLKVADASMLNVVNWAAFGVPSAIVLIAMSWCVMRVVARSAMASTWVVAPESASADVARQRRAQRVLLFWLGTWMAVLACGALFDAISVQRFFVDVLGKKMPLSLADLAALMLFVGQLGLLLLGGEPLLRMRDLWRELPVKGLILGGAVLVVLGGLAYTGVLPWLAGRIEPAFRWTSIPFVAVVLLITSTIFATEFFNNTTVATVAFPLAVAAAQAVNVHPLYMMIGVSLASTCAFMTPLATPVNALAFGALPGVSLSLFVRIGALVNVFAALWLSICVRWWIPWVLGV
ncbi:MAG: SLC13 family permease [Deltaproteobacteria bacterium]|nr:SLC13 family permease [Deltaproteobacteria bacterium]